MIPVSFFSEAYNQVYKWSVTGARSVSIVENGNVVGTGFSGTYRIRGFGQHTVLITANANNETRMTVVVTVEGIEVINTNNEIMGTTGYEPCVEYDVDSARTTCRPGYILKNRSVPDHTIFYLTLNGVRIMEGPVISNVIYTNPRGISHSWYDANRNPNPRANKCIFIDTTSNGPVSRDPLCARSELVPSNNQYYCTPIIPSDPTNLSSCRSDRIIGVTGYKSRIVESTTVDVTRTPTEEIENIANKTYDQRVREATQRVRAEEQARRNSEIQTNINSERDIGVHYTGDVARVDSQDTKYRIISPKSYSTINGRQVPSIQYESVRFLSPESVSSYILRGYILETVNQNIPVSSSKPYGISVIDRSLVIRDSEKGKFIPTNDRKKRVTFSDVSKSKVRKTFSAFKRKNSRRIVS